MEQESADTHRRALSSNIMFGPFDFDVRRSELRRHGHPVAMPASQLRLLELFLQRAGELVTRDEIAARLWTDTRTIDVPSGINTAVNRLRRTLQDSPGGRTPIETVIGLGYRFVPAVTEVRAEIKAPEQAAVLADAPAVGLSMTSQALENGCDEPSDTAVMQIAEAQTQRGGEQDDTLEQARSGGAYNLSIPFSQAGTKRWMTAAVALCALTLGIFTVIQLRHSARGVSAERFTTAETSDAGEASPLVRVTNDDEVGKLTASAVSPSGRFLAYADPFGVSIHTFASSTKRLLDTRSSFTVDRLSWFPDESGLLMSGADGISHRKQVWLAPVDSPYARLLVEDADRAELSPTGGQMAFLRGQGTELWLAGSNGEHPRLLRTAQSGEAFDLVLWSPAGNRLLIATRKALPSGSTNGGALEFLDAESGHLLHREQGIETASGYLLNDGGFRYIENATPGPLSGVASVMMLPIDLSNGRVMGAPKRIRDLEAKRADSLSASRTGARTAAVLQRAGIDTFIADVTKPNLELRHVTRLTWDTVQAFPHSWTADGRSVLVEKDPLNRTGAAARSDIFKIPVNGEKPTLLAKLPEDSALAQLSPDGRWILFLGITSYPQRVIGLYRIPVSGGPIESVPLTGEITEFFCSGSEVGRCVARRALGKEALAFFALDPLSGMGQELGRVAWQPHGLGDWAISTDGNTVAIATHDALQPGIRLMRLEGKLSEMHAILLHGHGSTLGVNWAPDGKSLYVECRTDRGFELISLGLDGRTKLLRKSAALIWAVPSRDGKKIAFPDVTRSESLWTSVGKP